MRHAIPKEPIPFKEFTPHITPSSDLALRISRLQDEMAEYVEKRVAELKASADGRDLPAESLRRMLVRGECPCQACLRLSNE